MNPPALLSIQRGCKENNVKKQLGLSLVELMISIALGLVLMAGVLQMFISTKSSYTVQQGMSRIQETGRMAMEFMGRDLRIVSQMGCVKTFMPGKDDPFNIISPPGLDLGGLHKDFLVGLMGYDNPQALEDAGEVVDEALIASTDPTPNSNILVMRGTTEKGFPLSVKSTADDITVFAGNTALSNNCIEGLCANGAAVVSDCDSGVIFSPTTLEKAGQLLTIKHDGGWDGETDNRYLYEARPEVFVYPLHTIVYFVAPSTTANNEPALWQKLDALPAQELILGVERIRFTYRLNGQYLAASAITVADDWNFVDAVRVDFVVRGQEENALESVQSYTFPGDAAATVPTDRRIRQLFTNTFSIRTRNNQL